MQDQLEQISDAEEALFKSRLAGAIYLELKSRPHKFSELQSNIECSPNSLTTNLDKGKEVGVWEKSSDHYRLTSRGKELPEAIAIHAKLQQCVKVEYRGTTYHHADVPSGISHVTHETSGTVFVFDKQFSDVDLPEDTPAEELLNWFNPAFSYTTRE